LLLSQYEECLSFVAWAYLHLPLLMGIVATGAGVSNVLTHNEAALTVPDRWLSTGAVMVTLSSLGLLELVLRRDANEPTHPRASAVLKFAGGLLALAIGWAGGEVTPAVLLGGLLMCVLVQMVYGTYVWYRPEPRPRELLEIGD
jgi:hypothetical protein